MGFCTLLAGAALPDKTEETLAFEFFVGPIGEFALIALLAGG